MSVYQLCVYICVCVCMCVCVCACVFLRVLCVQKKIDVQIHIDRNKFTEMHVCIHEYVLGLKRHASVRLCVK